MEEVSGYHDSKLLRKVTLVKKSFITGNKKLTLRKAPKLMLDELKYWTDLQDRLGVKHKVLFHVLMCCLIFDWILRFSIYYLDIFGRFDYNRGILSLDLQIFSVPALMTLYAYYWIA